MATDKLVDFDHVTDYISREAAIELLTTALDDEWEPEYAQDRLSEIPAADVRPVVRGKWVLKEMAHYFKCSICKEPIAYRFGYGGNRYYNFCPNCGADMRKASEDG